MSDEEIPQFPQRIETADTRANLRRVAPGLYVGGATAVCERSVRGHDWWAVVDCHGPKHTSSVQREVRFGQLDRVIRYAFEDGSPVPEALLVAAEALYRRQAGPLLISCAAGVSRSASVAYALLRVVRGLSPDEAMARVACAAGRPLPNTVTSAEKWATQRLVERSTTPMWMP